MTEEASNPVSFLPDDYLEKKAQRRANFVCAILAVTVVATIGAAFMATQRMNLTAEDEHAMVLAQYSQATVQIRQVNELQEKQKKLAHEAEVSDSLLEKVPRSNLLAAITNSLPPGVSLLDFQMEAHRRSANEIKATAAANAGPSVNMPGLTPSAAASQTTPLEYDVDMKLTGVASNDVQVSDYISHLNKSPLFKDVNLVESDEYQMDKQKMRKFQLAMSLDPSARVQPTTQPAGDPEKSASIR